MMPASPHPGHFFAAARWTLFTPITFIVGVYGMNFANMPELELRWAYPAVWIVMGLVVTGMLIYFLVLFPSAPTGVCCSTAAPAENNHKAEDKAEVIPAARVVDFIDRHVVGEKRDDKGDRRDKTMPETVQEAPRPFFFADGPAELRIGAGRATGQHNQHHNQQNCLSE